MHSYSEASLADRVVAPAGQPSSNLFTRLITHLSFSGKMRLLLALVMVLSLAGNAITADKARQQIRTVILNDLQSQVETMAHYLASLPQEAEATVIATVTPVLENARGIKGPVTSSWPTVAGPCGSTHRIMPASARTSPASCWTATQRISTRRWCASPAVVSRR